LIDFLQYHLLSLNVLLLIFHLSSIYEHFPSLAFLFFVRFCPHAASDFLAFPHIWLTILMFEASLAMTRLSRRHGQNGTNLRDGPAACETSQHLWLYQFACLVVGRFYCKLMKFLNANVIKVINRKGYFGWVVKWTLSLSIRFYKHLIFYCVWLISGINFGLRCEWKC
jgi:hypothetical protein